MVPVLAIAASTTGVMLALAPLLQLRLILTRRHSDDVSIAFLLVVVLGVSMWSAYGLAKDDMFLFLPNLLGAITNLATVLVAWHFRSKNH